jgi:hypothetical protein
VQTFEELFGRSPASLALESAASPLTPSAPAMATTEATHSPPDNPLRALLDPRNSAIFWVALAAIIGLVAVTGQLKVSAALSAKGGK